MGGIHLIGGEKYHKSPNTAYRKAKNVEIESVNYSLNFLSNYVLSKDQVCIIYAMGGQSFAILNGIKKIPGIDTLTIERYLVGNFFHKFLSYLLNAYHGLFEIQDSQKLTEAFMPVVAGWMAGIIIVKMESKNLIIDAFKKYKNSNKVREVIEQDASYFLYEVDGDNFESTTGIVQIISYGNDCPKELVSFIL